jgi:CheY-like chemotaxis protein
MTAWEESKNMANMRSKPKTRFPRHDLKSIEILLVNDGEWEARLTIRALKTSTVRNRVHWVEDGVEAMDYLRQKGAHAGATRPDLILLDWVMPRMCGCEVLEQIKQDPDLKRIPVVIWTASDQDADVLQAYNLHANCYVTTPVNADEFVKKVRCIEDFWLTIVRLFMPASSSPSASSQRSPPSS